MAMGVTLDLRNVAYLMEDSMFQELIRQATGVAEQVVSDPTIGFTDLPETTAYVDACDRVLDGLPGDCKTLVVLGIGGSALGTRMLMDAFPADRTRRVVVVDNVDPEPVRRLLDELDPRTTVLNVVSKSGSTLEPLALFSICFHHFEQVLGRAETVRRCVVTTDPETGPLLQFAQDTKVATLPVPKNVGGRFSVLTPVSLFPLMFSGLDPIPLLLGAKKEKRDGVERAAIGAALDYVLQEQSRNIKVIFPYCDRLYRFGEWYLQLFAESLGKLLDRKGRVVRTGQTAVVARGATDQHSQLQLYKEGPGDKGFFFFRVREEEPVSIPGLPGVSGAPFHLLENQTLGRLLDAEAAGTMMSLERNGLPVVAYELDRLDLETMGRLIYLFELQTAMTGYLLNINPFDQPGVEEGKRIAKDILAGRLDGDDQE